MLIEGINPAYLYELKHLISVTQDDYQQLYVQPIQTLAASLKDSTKLDQMLAHVIATLKIRRAYMLPVGTDAETCYQQQDAWTYALFTAVLLKDVSQNSDNVTTAIKKWLPDAGIAWLKKYTPLFKAWEDFLTGKINTNNIIAHIIYQAEDALMGNKLERVSKNNDTCLADAPTITVDNIEENQPTQPAETTTFTLTDSFIAWIKRNLARNDLTINTPTALLHRVDKGVLLIMPELYRQFLQAHPSLQAVAADKSDEELLDELTTAQCFIKNPRQTGFMHTYYSGEWDTRDLISGLLIEASQLFTEKTMPAINTQLQIDQI